MSKPLEHDRNVLLKNCHQDQLSNQEDDKPIIITNVRSLSMPKVKECQIKQIKPVVDLIDLEQDSAPIKHKAKNAMITGNSHATVDSSAVRNVEKQRKERTLVVWTSDGYFTFVVPNNSDDKTKTIKLVSREEGGTPDDPIIIDDNE